MANARRSRKEILEGKVSAAEAKLEELQKKEAALKESINGYRSEIAEIEKAEKAAAEEEKLNAILKEVKKSEKTADEIIAFLRG